MLGFSHFRLISSKIYFLCFLVGSGWSKMRWVACILRCSMLLMLLGLASILANASPIKNDFGHCERVVKKWAFSSLDQEVKEDRHTLQDLLFFLHVPRTGGRTYFHCFLKKLYSKSLECPRSYDKLRFDPRKPKCRLLVTHDDYSMMSKLPNHRTSVVTILRNPVDRVFSTYEFSVEVAARFLVHPNLTSATQMAGRLRAKMRGVSTLDIWPWKYLVPWMREDLFARRDARRQKGSDDTKSSGSYDMNEIFMPLHEYINTPMAHDIVHNGATFQVAGLTNNSYLAESHEVRHCVQKYKILGEHVLQVAKKRLDNMLYVGLTEEHKESATMFANVVGAQVISQRRASAMSLENVANENSEQNSLLSDSEFENDYDLDDFVHSTSQVYLLVLQNRTLCCQILSLKMMTTRIAVLTTMQVRLLPLKMVKQRNKMKEQGRRRTASLKRISPAKFSKEGRRQVPEVVLQQIKSLNSLDLELYKYAEDIFAKQHKHTMEKLFAIIENLFT
ncbi:protein-tyrosine sulfotransferase-like isoform X4 [Carya illinoinensis]|uniref:protein-tyrosine sulfotransferase-like isoform X4 n=1 Tax=Carya illinoinensis TaxID=32201 RepID=UPI001C71BC7D|nr:protein-tyrosine sulfotransferase-like isoform X4 [Carya illinoinensis]